MSAGGQVRSLVLHRADLSDDAALEGLARSLPRARGLHSLAIGDCDMTLRGVGGRTNRQKRLISRLGLALREDAQERSLAPSYV